MKANYGIFFASKNNYDLLENWLLNYLDYVPDNIKILNLDLGSCESQKTRGKQICQKFNLIFIKSRKTEFQDNIGQIFDELSKLKIENLLYLHQDCFPIDRNTFLKINKIPEKYNIEKLGLVGFNIYHDIEISKLKLHINEYMTTSRSVLQKGNGYYMSHPKGSRVNYKNFIKGKPFVVENIMWAALFLNKKSFLTHINIDLSFNFFLAPDDMAYQFLNKNIFNVVFPEIRFKHDQNIKTNFSLPKNSPSGLKKDVIKLYGRIDHVSIWKKKWGFDYDLLKAHKIYNFRIIKKFFLVLFPKFYSNLETLGRKSYSYNKNKVGLFNLFYNHDPEKGPLKYIKRRKGLMKTRTISVLMTVFMEFFS